MSQNEDQGLILGASDRIELIATIVMAAAAILTAWAAFQSAKWSGVQAVEVSGANAARIESTRFDTRAGQVASIDVDVFLSWLEAVGNELDQDLQVIGADGSFIPLQGTLSSFFFERMRDELEPALDSWLDDRPLTDPDAPATPFVTGHYESADARLADPKLAEAREQPSRPTKTRTTMY